MAIPAGPPVVLTTKPPGQLRREEGLIDRKWIDQQPAGHAGGFPQLSHGIVLCVIASGAARQLLLKVVVECFTYCHQLASGHLLDMPT
jgi:hypothetical protein